MRKKNIILLILVINIVILSITACTSSKNQEALTRTEFLMDTVITLKVFDNKDEKVMDKAIDRLKEIENRMSVTIDSSDVNLINQNAGIKPIKVNDDTYFVIEKAKYFAEISKGAYDPTIGPLVELWDITGSDEKERESIPTEEEINKMKTLVDYNDLILMEDNLVYLNRKGMKIDLGGIVKGYAADEVKRIFLENDVNSAIIDLGGNIYALGDKPSGEAWKIGIQDPFTVTGNYIGILNTIDSSIVTSGDYERYFVHKGERYHHIIDAKTGYPAKNEISGISIISNKSIDGDALSTALFVMGIEEGTKLVNSLEDINTIFITKEKEVIISKKLESQFTLSNDNLKLKTNPF
mgnify:FL=1